MTDEGDEMKIAYIILAYKNPRQLLRLTNALQSASSAFFIHVDKSSDFIPFKKAFATSPNNLTFTKREYSYWGSIGCVKACLNGLQQVLVSPERYDYLYFLSGQDYPIKSVSFIENFLFRNMNKAFIQCMKLPDGCWGGNGGIDRFTYYHYHKFKNRNVIKIANRCLKYLHAFFPERKSPSYIRQYYGGEFYFGFNREVAKYIADFVDSHEDYMNFHKYTYCPDEIFFQTILKNSEQCDKIREGIADKSMTYVDWSRPEPRPAILTVSNFDSLLKSEKLFARKFDCKVDEKILDMIDEKIMNAS